MTAGSPLTGLTSPFSNGFLVSSGDFSVFGFLVRVPAADVFLSAEARAAATLLAAAVGADGLENPDRLMLPAAVAPEAGRDPAAVFAAVVTAGLLAGNRRAPAGLAVSVPAPSVAAAGLVGLGAVLVPSTVTFPAAFADTSRLTPLAGRLAELAGRLVVAVGRPATVELIPVGLAAPVGRAAPTGRAAPVGLVIAGLGLATPSAGFDTSAGLAAAAAAVRLAAAADALAALSKDLAPGLDVSADLGVLGVLVVVVFGVVVSPGLAAPTLGAAAGLATPSLGAAAGLAAPTFGSVGLVLGLLGSGLSVGLVPALLFALFRVGLPAVGAGLASTFFLSVGPGFDFSVFAPGVEGLDGEDGFEPSSDFSGSGAGCAGSVPAGSADVDPTIARSVMTNSSS